MLNLISCVHSLYGWLSGLLIPLHGLSSQIPAAPFNEKRLLQLKYCLEEKLVTLKQLDDGSKKQHYSDSQE